MHKVLVSGFTYTYKRVRIRGTNRILIWEKGAKGIKGNIIWKKNARFNKANVIRNVLEKKPPKRMVIEIPPKEEKWYRISKVYMAYHIQTLKKTPTPFAELRIYVFTQRPEIYNTYMFDKWKNDVIRKPHTEISLSYKNTDYRIEGYEKEEIGRDEVKKEMDTPFYYIKFWVRGKEGEIKEMEYEGRI